MSQKTITCRDCGLRARVALSELARCGNFCESCRIRRFGPLRRFCSECKRWFPVMNNNQQFCSSECFELADYLTKRVRVAKKIALLKACDEFEGYSQQRPINFMPKVDHFANFQGLPPEAMAQWPNLVMSTFSLA